MKIYLDTNPLFSFGFQAALLNQEIRIERKQCFYLIDSIALDLLMICYQGQAVGQTLELCRSGTGTKNKED